MRILLTLAAAALVSLGTAACGSDESGDSGDTDAGSSGAEIPGGADAEAVEVIDDWSRTLREGDVEGAAEYFGVPSVVQNGTPPIELRTREQVVAFNRALPCGAELLEATQEERFILATFELTERPGGGCGAGVGEEARTAFVILEGEIVEWRRADEPTVEPPADGPVV